MNLLEMSAFTGKILGDVGEQYHTKSEKVISLNNAMVTVCRDSRSLITWVDAPTVEGDDRYPFPIDFLAIKDVQLIEGDQRYQLERLSYDNFETAYGFSRSGRPLHYRLEFGATNTVPGSAPGDLTLGPTPDATARVLRLVYFQRCTKFIGDGSDDNNSYELAEIFHKAVCYQAALDLSLTYDDNSRATKYAALYNEEMAKAESFVARMDSTGPASGKRAYGSGRAAERRRR